MGIVRRLPAYTQKYDISVVSFETHLPSAQTVFLGTLVDFTRTTATHGRVMSFTDFMLTLRTHQIISTIADAMIQTKERLFLLYNDLWFRFHQILTKLVPVAGFEPA